MDTRIVGIATRIVRIVTRIYIIVTKTVKIVTRIVRIATRIVTRIVTMIVKIVTRMVSPNSHQDGQISHQDDVMGHEHNDSPFWEGHIIVFHISIRGAQVRPHANPTELSDGDEIRVIFGVCPICKSCRDKPYNSCPTYPFY